MGIEQQLGEKNSRFGFKSLLKPVAAIALAGASAVVLFRGVIPEWMYLKNIMEEAQKSGLPISEVKKYESLLGELFFTKYIAKDIDLQTLEVLLKDHEIIQRAKEGGDNENLKSNINWTLVDLVQGEFIYDKSTGRIVNRRDIHNINVHNAIYRGLYSVIEDSYFRDYLDLHNKQKNGEKKIGFFTMFAANAYGISTNDLLRIPGEINEDYFSSLETEKIPPSYSVQGLLEGKTPAQIIGEYAIEVVGVPAEVRRQYRGIKAANLTDKGIRLLVANGITPAHVEDMVREVPKCIGVVFQLVEQGKLNGNIYEEWRPEVSVDDTLCGLLKGYTREEAIKITLSGESLWEFDEKLRSYLFNGHFINAKDRTQTLSNVLTK